MKQEKKELLIAVIIVIIILVVKAVNNDTPKSSSSDRTMGKCWICGKSGSFQLDGSYYCFEHYNDRLFGKFG